MNIKEFATQYGLRIERRRDDSTDVIPGRGDSHIYEYDRGLLGVMIMPGSSNRRSWGACRARFQAAGMTIAMNGDREGAATFDPSISEQAKVAIKAAGARKARKLTPEHIEALQRSNRATRFQSQRALNTTIDGSRGGRIGPRTRPRTGVDPPARRASAQAEFTPVSG